jgi:clan AA aspartic protease
VNGIVDQSGRALVDLIVRPMTGVGSRSLTVWVDTAFTGELVAPRIIVDQLRLPLSSAVMAGLADGAEVMLDTYSCVVEWFGEVRQIEVIESDAQLPLLGIGLLRGRRLELDYRLRTLTID